MLPQATQPAKLPAVYALCVTCMTDLSLSLNLYFVSKKSRRSVVDITYSRVQRHSPHSHVASLSFKASFKWVAKSGLPTSRYVSYGTSPHRLMTLRWCIPRLRGPLWDHHFQSHSAPNTWPIGTSTIWAGGNAYNFHGWQNISSLRCTASHINVETY